MEKDYFRFKKFKLRNRDSALKINTDGVLLAAWAKLLEQGEALDIGTGGGVIACILASKAPALKILGIDINPRAIIEAEHNILINPQFHNLSFSHLSYQELLGTEMKFDTIISNPPFFNTAMPSENTDTAMAKHTLSLSPDLIIETSADLLSDGGTLNVVTNHRDISEIQNRAISSRLYISRLSQVKPKPTMKTNRLLMEFSKDPKAKISTDSVIIIRNQDGSYHDSYKKLTRELYLKF